MNRFDECLHHVLGFEGGFSDHPLDKGGATNCGVTQAVYDMWRIQQGFGRQPVIGISSSEIEAVYRDLYWKPGRCEQLPQPLDLVHFDGCVNHGVSQAGKFLQRALMVKDDGVVGPKTLSAAQQTNAAHISHDIIGQRRDFYRTLAERHPAQNAFLRGWMNRLDMLADIAYGQGV